MHVTVHELAHVPCIIMLVHKNDKLSPLGIYHV